MTQVSPIVFRSVSSKLSIVFCLPIDLLAYFASANMPFMMECCTRTEADKKGGHLALRVADQQLILRESAQCAKVDEPMFQDISRHKFFNTNNLWVRLDLLKALMASKGGFVPLPTILNGKTDLRFELEHPELGGLVFRLNSLLNQLMGVQEDDTDDDGRPSRPPGPRDYADGSGE